MQVNYPEPEKVVMLVRIYREVILTVRVRTVTTHSLHVTHSQYSICMARSAMGHAPDVPSPGRQPRRCRAPRRPRIGAPTDFGRPTARCWMFIESQRPSSACEVLVRRRVPD